VTYLVRFRPKAAADLDALYDYIAEHGSPFIALGYIDRLEKACLSLRDFPYRGTPRDDLGDGVRTLTFERRVVIAYRVEEEAVRILRVVYAGRDIEAEWLE